MTANPKQGRGSKDAVGSRDASKWCGMIPELDLFDYSVDKISSNKFHLAKRKLRDYLGSRFGFNAL